MTNDDGFQPYVPQGGGATATVAPPQEADRGEFRPYTPPAEPAKESAPAPTSSAPQGIFDQTASMEKKMASPFVGAAKGAMSSGYEAAGLGNWLGKVIGKVPLIPGVVDLDQATQGIMRFALKFTSPEQRASLHEGATKMLGALEQGAEKPAGLTPSGTGEQVGYSAEKAGEFFLPGLAEGGALKAARATEAAGAASKSVEIPSLLSRIGSTIEGGLKPAAEQLAVASKQQGQVTPESAVMAGVGGIFSQLGKIPQVALGGTQAATGAYHYFTGDKAQGLVDVGMGLLGIHGGMKEEGLLRSVSSMTPEEIRARALDQYDQHVKPLQRELKSQQRSEIFAEATGKEKPRPVSEILFDERVPLNAYHDGQGLRYDTTDQVMEMNRRIAGLQDTKSGILSNPDKQHDLEDLKQQAIGRITSKSAYERSQMEQEVSKYFDAEIARHGRNVDDKTLDTIKGGFHEAGNWQTMTPGEAHIRKSATLLKEALEKSNADRADLGRLNSEQGELIRARNYLQAIEGSVVRGGIMGKKLAGIGGAIAGHALSPVPVLGPLAGSKVAEMLHQRMIDPTRGTRNAIERGGSNPVPRSEQVRMKIEQQIAEHDAMLQRYGDIHRTDTQDYGMKHRPTKTGTTADEITQVEQNKAGFPKDFYQHPEYYENMDGMSEKESFAVLKRIRGNPESEITIYRASPKKEFNYGDWVSLSKEYAKSESISKGVKVYALKVKAKDIHFDGNSINEFGYYPEGGVAASAQIK